MKLIYISHWRFPSEKTMSPLIMRTCQEFATQGYEVELWAPRRRNPDFAKADPFACHGIKPNFRITLLPAIDVLAWMPHVLSFPLLVLSFNISLIIQYLLRCPKGELVFYVHDVRDFFLLSFFTNHFFVEIHDFYKSRIDVINRRVLSRAQGVITTNEFKGQKIIETYGVPREKILHEPNAVDIGMFDVSVKKNVARDQLQIFHTTVAVVYTGHLFDWKGVDTLLEASALLPDNYKVYFVGGTDEDIESFRKKQAEVSPSRAVVVGRRPHDQIPLWLRAADIVALPNTAKIDASKYETSPVKLFEYMASRAPIVASRLPSIQNVVTEDMVWFFEPDDAQSCASVIQTAHSNSKYAAEKSQRGFNEVQNHSWDKRVSSIRQFIEGSLG